MSTKLLSNAAFKKAITTFNLKKIKDKVGHDDNGLHCDLCLKSTVILHFSDDGFGGDSQYTFTTDVNEQYLLDFIKEHNLAQILFENGYAFMGSVEKITSDTVIDEIVAQLYNLKNREKQLKAFERRCKVAIVCGVDENNYAYYGYTKIKSLSDVSLKSLQGTYDKAVSELRKGEKILNSDDQLKSLGIKLSS